MAKEQPGLGNGIFRLMMSHCLGQLPAGGVGSRDTLHCDRPGNRWWPLTEAVRSWELRCGEDIRGVYEVEMTEFGHTSSLEGRERWRSSFWLESWGGWWCHLLTKETQEGKNVTYSYNVIGFTAACQVPFLDLTHNGWLFRPHLWIQDSLLSLTFLLS